MAISWPLLAVDQVIYHSQSGLAKSLHHVTTISFKDESPFLLLSLKHFYTSFQNSNFG